MRGIEDLSRRGLVRFRHQSWIVGTSLAVTSSRRGVVLVHRNRGDYWQLPGGVFTSKSKKIDAVSLELFYAQTGLSIQNPGDPVVKFDPAYAHLHFLYSVDIKTQPDLPGTEASWRSLDSLPQQLRPGTLELLVALDLQPQLGTASK